MLLISFICLFVLRFSEWLVNQHRDSYASYIGHVNMMLYFSVAENVPMGRLRYKYLEKIVDPCGPPPPPKTEDELVAAANAVTSSTTAATAITAASTIPILSGGSFMQ